MHDTMKIDLSQFREVFLQESAEHIESMEAGLLRLRSAPDDLELLNAIFRSAHSIKGGAGSFGLTNLVRFTHTLENLLDRMRSMEIPASDYAIGLLLQSVDVLRAILGAGEHGDVPPETPALLESLEALVSAESPLETRAAGLQEEAQAALGSQLARYKVGLRPHQEMFSSGCNPLLLVRNLAALGSVHACDLDTTALPALKDIDPALCYLGWTVDLTTAEPEAALREVFEFVEHMADITIERIEGPLAETGEALDEVQLPAGTKGSEREPARQAASQPEVRTQKTAASAESSSIRVSTDKVDRLIDLVGELVIAHVMTEQMVENFTPACLPQLRQAVAAMERSTRELHERVMSIRMMPVGSLFQRYPRVVYDIAQATGKQIVLQLSGEETEIDKSMLELLGDPLIHLIRNSADHGIELPGTRRYVGKPEQGTITLSACHRSGRIAIEITDDGAGIDVARVRAKAIERGLIQPETPMTDQQIRMLIFEPGFSTRDVVSDLSGRGVGMDVVKRNIQRLSGSVTLASELGLGSKITIELPLTLAIVEGLLVRVRDRTLVLPLLSVVETVAPGPGQIVRLAGRGEAVMIHGESVAVIRLSRFLGFPDQPEIEAGEDSLNPPERSLIVVVESGARKIGLLVDELMGQQQVVLKSLERHLHKIEGLMGATILGDGCVAPIVDVIGIANLDLFSTQPVVGGVLSLNQSTLATSLSV
jgi:two-component system chemotaxis sensor kinase CheA